MNGSRSRCSARTSPASASTSCMGPSWRSKASRVSRRSRGGDERVLALVAALEQELPLEDRLERTRGGGEEGGRLRAVGDGCPPDDHADELLEAVEGRGAVRRAARRCAAPSGRRERGLHLAAGLAADLARAEVDEAFGFAGGATAPERRLVEDAQVDEQPELQARSRSAAVARRAGRLRRHGCRA